ncbi:hypothetical protein MNBD_DELTA03-1840 [hydrothermal vent metagenome]|uniref:CzcB-like C-terminal circularly permuted SH3-like domain-containing protein n=1 Tax=hydrothermal vent metagenome TaxID=652676 RepID=A0A3B0VD86_9ZZZZ
MKGRRFIILFMAALIIGTIITSWHTGISLKPTEASAAADNLPAAPPLIVTAQPVRQRFYLRVPWSGTVEPCAAVTLITRISGRITAIEAEDQTRIAKGAAVARLGGPLLETRHARLAAKIKALKSQLGLARQTVKELARNLQAQLTTSREVAAAQGTQLKLKGQLRQARLNLAAFEKQILIHAPISGIFTGRLVSLGQDVVKGQTVGRIIDTGHLRITAALFPPPDFDLHGKEATIYPRQGQRISGIIQRLLPETDSTGAVMVWIEGPQINKELRPGQTVSGVITAPAREARLTVPRSAVVYGVRDRPYLIIKKGGTYKPHRVRLGLRQRGRVEILSGLHQNQTIVTKGSYELFYKEFTRQFKVQD